MKALIEKLSLWVRGLEGASGNAFSFVGFYGGKKYGKKSVIEIDRCIKEDLVNLHSGFSNYFPEQVNIFIMDPFSTDSPQNYEFLSKK